MDLPDPGIEPRSLALWADSLPAEPQGKPLIYGKTLPNKAINWYLFRDLRYKVSTCITWTLHTTLDPQHQKTTAEDDDLLHQRIINTSRINQAIFICIICSPCHDPYTASAFCMWTRSSQNASVSGMVKANLAWHLLLLSFFWDIYLFSVTMLRSDGVKKNYAVAIIIWKPFGGKCFRL